MFDYDDFCPGGETDGGDDTGPETGDDHGGETVSDQGGETVGDKGGEPTGKDGESVSGKDGANDRTASGRLDLSGSKPESAESVERSGSTERAENAEKSGSEKNLPTHEAQSRVKIDGTYYRTDDNGKIHMYRDNEDKTYKLLPNNEYTSRGYDYKTDDKGRIAEAHGTLRISDKERGSLNAKVEDMEKGDERGHIISAKNDASDRIDNLIPMTKELNDGEYKSFEASLNKLAEKNDVEVTYTPVYNEGNNSKRPDVIAVAYTLTDRETGEKSETCYRFFDNASNASKEDE